MSVARSGAFGLGLAWLLGAAQPALAWRQYHTSLGKPMRWSAASLAQPLAYSLDDSGLGDDGIGADDLAQAAQAALGTWQAVQCPTCKPACDQAKCARRALGVAFAVPTWKPAQPIGMACVDPGPAGCATYAPNGNQLTFVHQALAWPYGKQVIAMTVVSAKTDSGEIADADIAFNDAGYPFCLQACAAGQIHVGAAILHEAGHFIGLDHSLDDHAVMYAKPPETVDRQGELTEDDRQGACVAYPSDVSLTQCVTDAATAPGQSPPSAGDGGCRAALAVGNTLPLLAILIGALALLRCARTCRRTGSQRTTLACFGSVRTRS